MWSTAFAALSLAARLACVDADPERLSCPIPDEVALRLAVRDESMIDSEILSHVERLVRDALAEQGLRVTEGATPLSAEIAVRYVSLTAFAERCKADGLDGEPVRYRGFARIREREALVRVTPQAVLDADFCKEQAVLALAMTTLHEIGHLLGLPHVGDETPASDIPMNLPDGRWNTMMQGVVGSRSCGRDPADLSTRDLQSAFHDTQGVMMRSAASGGSVWKRLLDAGYDFNSFVNSYNQAIDRRGQPAP